MSGVSATPWRWWVAVTMVAGGAFGFVFWLLLRWFG